jgi:hypothetical protein
VVNFNKKNLDVCVGFPCSVNDVRVLGRSTLYRHAQYHNLFDPSKGVEGILPYLYLLGDKGYFLINWIMTSFKEDGQHSILKLFYNKKHKSGKFVVENVFGILKKMFKEFQRSKMRVTFIFDMFTCCHLMHNLLKSEDEENIGRLPHIIELEIVAHGEQINKNVVVVDDDNINWIEGLELSCDAI